MENSWTINLIWWISAVEIPALAGIFWLIWYNKNNNDAALSQQGQSINQILTQARESLSSYKLEVAKSYVSIGYLKDVERRLTSHLLRIEAKLENNKK